jgi:amidase
VPELTLWPFTETRTFGATRNPWNLGHSPGGSSGGTAAAVAAGMVGAGVGSDGGGSIRIPAAWSGLFGIKPTRDLVSMEPHTGAWEGLAVNGPLARSVADAALLLDALADVKPERPFSDAVAPPARRLKIAYSAKKMAGAPPIPRPDREWVAAMESTAEILRGLGHEVVAIDPDYGFRAFPHFLTRYLRGAEHDAALLPQPERVEARTRGVARLGRLVPPGIVRRYRAGEAALRDRIWGSLQGADVFMTPANALPAPEIGRWEGKGAIATLNGVAGFMPYAPVFNATGQPGVSVPAGWSREGLPIGVQLVAPMHGEHTLISLSAELETARPLADRLPPAS